MPQQRTFSAHVEFISSGPGAAITGTTSAGFTVVETPLNLIGVEDVTDKGAVTWKLQVRETAASNDGWLSRSVSTEEHDSNFIVWSLGNLVV